MLRRLLEKKNVDVLPKKPTIRSYTRTRERLFGLSSRSAIQFRSSMNDLVEKAKLNICEETGQKYLNEAGLH